MIKKILIILLLILGFLVWAWWGYRTDNVYFLKLASQPILKNIFSEVNSKIYQRGVVQINENKIDVEIAKSAAAKIAGLSWRKSLAEGSGMLFVEGKSNYYSFWMKDMLFPIDIIWIANNQVVDISKNIPVPQGNNLPSYSPDEPANYVLEVNAGYADRHGIKVGDKVKIEVENK
jgi:uncharacterized membrane protein (UPF0127 family)